MALIGRSRTRSTRYRWKVAAVWLAHLFTALPAWSASVVYRRFGSESAFDFFAKLLSLVPGQVGRFARASYYVQTLPRCGYDVSIGFGSFISHNNVEIGRGVSVGAFAIIGTCTVGDNAMIGSRVSILSGKYQHGGGQRGRDFRCNEVQYDRITIGEGSWLGEGCIVMSDIGRNAIVSAGAVVTKPIPDGVTAVGNPARYLRYENETGGNRQLLTAGAMLAMSALYVAGHDTARAGEPGVARAGHPARDELVCGASAGRLEDRAADGAAARIGAR